jgi:hypothetical protein
MYCSETSWEEEEQHNNGKPPNAVGYCNRKQSLTIPFKLAEPPLSIPFKHVAK